jgi:general secretion pathway protein G
MRAKQTAIERGLTLIDTLVMLIILGGMIALNAINIYPKMICAKQQKARLDISTVKSGLKLYRLKHKRLPTQAEGLAALVSEGILEKMPIDPWGRLYLYEGYPGGCFHLRSLGADGEPGGTDEDSDIDGS